MVPLALIWSSKVPAAELQALADRLLAVKPNSDRQPAQQHRFGTGYGKPKFPVNVESKTLAGLVGPESWLVFHILQLDSQFLTEDVDKWPNCTSYQTSLENFRALLNVVNDCAER